MYKCSICGEVKKQGFFNHTNKFICRECEHLGNSLLFNSYEIINGEVVEISPFSSAQNQRARFIDYAYTLFGNKLAKQAYFLLNNYAKKYSYLGMARALEYFYVVKKNDKSKAKNNIAIIPYVYNEAQEFYEANNRFRRNSYIKNLEQIEKQKEATKTEFQVTQKTKSRFQIDLEGGV
jgi:hypothetical protein